MNSANHIEFHVDRIGIYGTEENRQVGGALQYGGLVTYSVHAQLLGGCLGSLAGRQAHAHQWRWVAGAVVPLLPGSLIAGRSRQPRDRAARPPARLPANSYHTRKRAAGRLAGWRTRVLMVMRDTDTADGPPPGAQRPRRRTPGICTTTLLPHHE